MERDAGWMGLFRGTAITTELGLINYNHGQNHYKLLMSHHSFSPCVSLSLTRMYTHTHSCASTREHIGPCVKIKLDSSHQLIKTIQIQNWKNTTQRWIVIV